MNLVFAHYNYDQHGLDWPGLCNTSVIQSPIDINPSLVQTIDPSNSNYWYLDLYYQPTHVINPNKTESKTTSGISFNPSINFSIFSKFGKVFLVNSFQKIEYLSISIDFHYPAEHTFDGKDPNTNNLNVLEIQIKHVNSANLSDVLILSIFCNVGIDDSYFISQIISSYTNPTGADIDCTFATNGWYVIRNFYSYYGSLTVPLCNEWVVWVLYNSPLIISQQQLNFFLNKLNNTENQGNYRYTKPQYGRVIKKYTDTQLFSSSLWFFSIIYVLFI